MIAGVAGRVVGVDQQPELVAQVEIPVSPLQLRDVYGFLTFMLSMIQCFPVLF